MRNTKNKRNKIKNPQKTKETKSKILNRARAHLVSGQALLWALCLLLSTLIALHRWSRLKKEERQMRDFDGDLHSFII